MRKIWQGSRFPADNGRLNRMTHEIGLEIKKYKNKRFNNYLQRLNNEKTSHYSLRKSTKTLSRPTTQITPIYMADENLARANSQKAELFSS